MTNLTEKFSQLEQLITGNHAAIIAALAAIQDALGGEPPEYTLGDVVDAINSLSVIMQGVAANQLSGNTTLTQMRASLNSMNTTLLGSHSIQASIQNFLVSNDWCCQGGTGTPVLPPLGTNPSVQGSELCMKAQGIPELIWVPLMDLWDARIAQTGPTTVAQVYADYQSIMSAHPDTSLPSQPELSTIAYTINRLRDAQVSNLGGLAFSFKSEVTGILFSSATASQARQNLVSWAQQRFNDPFTRDLMVLTIYNALLNETYDDSSRNLNVGGYNGEVCETIETGCRDAVSISVGVTPSFGYTPRWQAAFSGMPTTNTIESSPGLIVTYDEPVIMTDGFQGGRIYYKSGRVRVVYGVAGVSGFEFPMTQPGNWVDIPLNANFLILDDAMGPDVPGSGPFSVTFCFSGDI